MVQTVQKSTVLQEAAVVASQLLLDRYKQLHDVAADLAFLAASDANSPDSRQAYEQLRRLSAQIDSGPEGRAAERRRAKWHLFAGLHRADRPRNWRLDELPAEGGDPIWSLPYRGYTPALAYLVFKNQVAAATANNHRLILKEDPQ